MKQLQTYEQFSIQNEEIDWKKIRNTAMAGAMAIGAMGAHSQDKMVKNIDNDTKVEQSFLKKGLSAASSAIGSFRNDNSAEKTIKKLEKEGYKSELADKSVFLKQLEKNDWSKIETHKIKYGSESGARLTATQFIKVNKLNHRLTLMMFNEVDTTAILIYAQ